MHFAICHGPVDKFLQVNAGDKLAWEGQETASGSVTINKPELFGGDKKEGGISGSLAICMGEPAQTPNTYLQSQLGANIPAYRGVLSCVFNGMVAAVNPYIKPWSFRVERVTKGWHNDDCWYPAKAFVYTDTGPEVTLYDDFTLSASNVSVDGSNGRTISGLGPHDLITVSWPSGKTYSAYQSNPANMLAYWHNQFRVMYDDGSTTGVTWLWGQSYVNHWAGASAAAAEAAALAYAQLYGPITLTGSTSYKLWLPNVCDSGGLSLNITRTPRQADMNPIHIIYECLTNPDWGMGYPTSAIDDANFTEAADALYDEGFGLSFLWNQPDQIKSFIRLVLGHINGVLRIDQRTGLYQIKLLRDDYVFEDLPVVDISNATLDRWQRPAWGETVNEISVIYKNGSKDAVVTVQDMVNVSIQNATINKKQNYPGVTSQTLALRLAERDLRLMSTPLAKASLRINREAWEYHVGDVVRFTHTPMGIDAAYRILSMNMGTLQDNMVEVEASEDIFNLNSTTWGDQEPVGWEDPISEAAASPYRVIIETPYYTLARSLSTADLDYLEDTDCRVQVMAAQPSGDAASYKLWTAAGSADPEDRGDIGDFTQYVSLTAGAIKENSSTFEVDQLDDFILDSVEVGQYALIGDEIVCIDAWDADLLTIDVQRGCLDTVPAVHSIGAKLWFADAHNSSDEIDYLPTEVVHVICQTQTGDGYLNYADTPEDTYTIDQRHARPYPPGKFQINTSYWPETYTGRTVAVTWAHRDRLQQTAEIIPQTDASIGPEAGVTYNCRLYNGADVLMQEETGISGASHTFNISEARYFRIKSLDVAGGANFKISELRLYNNSSAVDAGATMTSSSAPSAGSLANLKDADTGTTAEWTSATAENAAFWIKWDAGVGNTMHVSEMRIGGATDSAEYLNGYSIQMSHDDSTWIDIAAVTGLAYPGNSTLSGNIDVRPADLKVELEAERAGLVSWQSHEHTFAST
jgi:hypothetical protein